jgi:hypothetical protein
MKTTQKLCKNLISILAIICLLVPAFAQAQDAIGRVIRTTGLVMAVNVAGAERQIARGSEIFEDETITTGPQGTTQLRLVDGAIINLEPGSFFSVDEFEYDGAGGAADSVVMTMVQGSMRTITGVIGEDPADTYEFNTQFASIGVRGTEYGVIVEPGGRVRVVVFDGSISVAPSAGGGAPVIVGLEGDSDAVDVTDDTTVIELDTLPPEVQAILAIVMEAVSDEDVLNLPPAEQAVEIQRRLDESAQRNNQEALNESRPGDGDDAGLLVDADGNPIVARTEDELNNARVVVVISVGQQDPNLFDNTTKDSVSSN